MLGFYRNTIQDYSSYNYKYISEYWQLLGEICAGNLAIKIQIT